MLLLVKYMVLNGRGLYHVECWYFEIEKDVGCQQYTIFEIVVTKYIFLIS